MEDNAMRAATEMQEDENGGMVKMWDIGMADKVSGEDSGG